MTLDELIKRLTNHREAHGDVAVTVSADATNLFEPAIMQDEHGNVVLSTTTGVTYALGEQSRVRTRNSLRRSQQNETKNKGETPRQW